MLPQPPNFSTTSCDKEDFEAALIPENCIGEVAVVERPTPELFFERYLKPNLPVVIRGFSREFAKEMTLDLLLARFGNAPISVFCGEKGSFDTVDRSEVVKKIAAAPPRERGYYVTNANIMASDEAPIELNHGETMSASELRNELLFPDLMPPGSFRQANLWCGSDGISTNLHFDEMHNFLALFSGKKEGIIFAPSESRAMYPIQVGEPYYEILSHVTLEKPDFATFPRYREGRYSRFALSPGDVLFLPAFYWHYVRSYDVSLALNYWFLGPLTAGAKQRRRESIYVVKNAQAVARLLPDFARGGSDLLFKAIQKLIAEH